MNFPGRYVATPAGHLFYRRAGTGPALVLLHGYLLSSRCFEGVVPALAQHFTVIAVDSFGFGESERPVSSAAFDYSYQAYAESVLQLLEALGITQATLLGHSMGGGIAMHAATLAPALIERLILVSPALRRFAMPRASQLLHLPYLGRFAFRRLLTRMLIKRAPHVSGMAHLYDYHWHKLETAEGRRAARAVLKMLALLPDFSMLPTQISAPTLIIGGRRDRVITPALLTELSQEISGAKLCLLEESGHAAFAESPALFLQQVEAFMGL